MRPLTLALLALAAALLVACAPASAQVTSVEGHPAGVQPRDIAGFADGDTATATSFANAQGNAVMHSVGIHVIYWDPQHYYHGDWQRAIDTFMHELGVVGGELDNVFAVDAQYTDTSNQPAADHFTLKGASDDYNAYPSVNGCEDPHAFLESEVPMVNGEGVCLSDAQVQAELNTYITQHALPQGLGNLYVMLTPPGVAVCLDGGGEEGHCSDFSGELKSIITDEEEGAEPPDYLSYEHSFCSYHRTIGEATKTPYVVIPWVAGGAADPGIGALDNFKAYDCQDGGFSLNEKKGRLEKETPAKKSTAQEEEYEEAGLEEKRELKEAEEVEGPHIQEPNQIAPKRSEDGGVDSGLTDVIVNQIAIELQNTVTDPLLNGWMDSAKLEATDECRNFFLPYVAGSATAKPETKAGTLANQGFVEGTYYLADAFDLAALKLDYPGVPCLPGVNLDPHFTAPNPVNAGEIVEFNGMESDITLNWGAYYPSGGSPTATYDVYTWNFGDGTPSVSGYAPATAQANSPEPTPCPLPWLAPCAGSVFHSYQYGGTYEVTLKVRDVGGNVESFSAPVIVDGPGPPVPTPEAAPGAGAGSGAGGSGSSAAPGSPSTTLTSKVPPPVAAASIASKSLKLALRKGLAVSYSVNEQVAGRFEVLLSRALARKLHIHGAPAHGLPAGTPAQLIIAKAVLVTTTVGHSTVHIKFSKRTARRLSKLHKVSLMLRLIVRNSSSHSPLTTTVLSRHTLSR